MRKRKKYTQIYSPAKQSAEQTFFKSSNPKPLNSGWQQTHVNQNQTLTTTQLKAHRKKLDQSGHHLNQISLSIQPKLALGAKEDIYEKEADIVAAKIINQSNNLAKNEPQKQLKSLSCPNIANQANDYSHLEKSIQQAQISGKSLDRKIRLPMEKAFGVDFSEVKIHHNSQSDSLNKSLQAKAFTTGKNVFFRQGEFNYKSKKGQELIAHELTHVIQQRNQPLIQRQAESNANQDSIRLKQDADLAIKRLKDNVISFYDHYDNGIKYLKQQIASESSANQKAIQPNLNLQALSRFILEEALTKLTQKADMTKAISYGIKDLLARWWQESSKNLQTQGDIDITDYLAMLIIEIEQQKAEILKLIEQISQVILNDFEHNDQQANFVKYLQEGIYAFKDELLEPSAFRQQIIKYFYKSNIRELEKN